jgi:hypothetical protein
MNEGKFMRLSEKTMELTFCCQFGVYISKPPIWFGLTQKQEATAGFDACTRLGGKLLILQFKASAETLADDSRRFYAPHDQMQALRSQCNSQRGVYYVFPLIGTTHELSNNPCILPHTWFLDVSQLPSKISMPTKKKGAPRKNKIHYIDVQPHKATIHSEAFDVELLSADELIKGITENQIGVAPDEHIFSILKFMKKNTVAGILY